MLVTGTLQQELLITNSAYWDDGVWAEGPPWQTYSTCVHCNKNCTVSDNFNMSTILPCTHNTITLFYRHSITETENVAIQNQKRVLLNAFQEERSDYEMYSSAAHLDKVIVSNEIVKNTCWVDLIKCLCNNQHSITWKVYCLGNVVTKRFDFQFDFCF